MSIILTINQHKLLLWQTNRKLILFSLPSLDQIQRYYIDVNFISCTPDNVIMVAAKNTIKFLKPILNPLRLVEFQQQFLEWQPIGGLCLSHAVVMYIPHSIAFYDRLKNFSKSWAITVVQQIVRIESSQDEKYMGMKVRELNNVIYMWHMDNLSSNANQEVSVSDPIMQWQFMKASTLSILTTRQFRVYLPTSNATHYLHYCIEIQGGLQAFCWMDSSLSPNTHDSRKSVDTLTVLNANGKVILYELYEMMKRVKSSWYTVLGEIEKDQAVDRVVRGWATDTSIYLVGEKDGGKPFVWEITYKNNKFIITTKHTYKEELGSNIQSISCVNPIVAAHFHDRTSIYQLNNKAYQLIKDIPSPKGILTKSLFITNQWVAIHHHSQQQYAIEVKDKSQMQMLFENQTTIYFINGIRAYKLNNQQLTSVGFIIKNASAKLIQVNTFTQSVLYKVKDEYMLLEYACRQDKITSKIIKSSSKKIISLRNGKWAELGVDEIVVGVEKEVLATYSLKKLYKTLLNENVSLEYDLYWTTHRGMILTINNYLFILQLLDGSQGYSLHLLKRGHNYLYKRFSAYCPKINVLDPRQLIVAVKNRVIKLGNRLGQLVFEDPYSLPETILQRQLLMRKFYPPHHPKVIDLLISCSEYNLAKLILIRAYQAILGNQNINYLYSIIGTQFLIQYSSKTQQEISKINLQIASKQQILRKLSVLILEQPHKIMLQQTGPLLIENQIQSLLFQIDNVRSMDYFSSAVLTQLQMITYKNLPFNTRQVAFLIHSINKDEAIGFLKPQKIKWEWMKKYSIPLWYNNVEMIRKWIDEIAMNEYRQNKQPLDCLLWYILANKKSLLITLFKSNQHSSKQHAAVFTFLQRDFTQANNLSAATKNAYALMDKKRYYHALAFFVLGNKYDECISICMNRLNDIALALAICILFNLDSSKVLELLMERGDVWAQHIAYFLKGNHINSYNCLFKDDNMETWQLEMNKCGYHPSIIQFASHVQASVQVKRQLQQQNTSQEVTFDLFDYFADTQTVQPTKTQSNQPKPTLQPNKDKQIAKAVRFYLQNNTPSLALMFNKDDRESQRAACLQEMMLTKNITPQLQQIVEDMQDILGLLTNSLTNPTKLNNILTKFYEQFKECFKFVNLTIIYPSSKQSIGNMLYYCYHGEKIINMMIDSEHIKNIKQLCSLGRLLVSLELKCYNQIDDIFQFKKEYKYTSEGYWERLKSEYNKMAFQSKVKSYQLMDCFEPYFYKFARKQKEDNIKGPTTDLKLSLEPSAILIFNQIIIKSLINKSNTLNKTINQKLNELASIITQWIESTLTAQIKKQYIILVKQGINSRLKLNLISNIFGEDFQSVGKVLIKVFEDKEELNNYRYLMSDGVKAQRIQKEAVEIFRNKQDGVRNFAINKNDGTGMQIVVLFKKGLKKIEVCESLSQRNRSQDGLSLTHDDQFYNTISTLKIESLLDNPHPNPFLQQKILEVINNRRSYDGVGLIRNSAKKGDNQYFKPADPIPYMDHNQLNSIECHYYLPLILIGGKGLIEVANFSNLKNFNRIDCAGMGEIVKLWSFQNRVTALDSSGNVSSYNFDSKYTNNCVYNLKKSNIVDFCPLNPSTLALLSNNSLQAFDTLLHPKRQNIFKIKFTNQPISVRSLHQMKLVVLKKTQILIYDVRMDRLQETKDIESQGKSLSTNYANKILVGRSDCKLKIFDLKNNTEQLIKVGRVSQKKCSIQSISNMGNCGLCLTTEGSIYLIDKI